MKSCNIIILFILFSLLGSSQTIQICADENTIDIKDTNNLTREIPNLIRLKDYMKLSQLMENISNDFKDDRNILVIMAWHFYMNSVGDSDAKIMVLREKTLQNVINLDLDPFPFRLGQLIDILDSHRRYLLANEDELSLINDRKDISQRIVHDWQKVLSYIDDTWDENSFELSRFVELPDNEPELRGRMSTGPYSILHLPSEKIKDKDKREKFERQVEEAKEMLEKVRLQQQAKRVRKGQQRIVKRFLVGVYSMQPFVTAELEAMLTEYKVDEAFAKEILDAVKEAEKNAPPLSEYRTWQSSDGLFKVKAKFVFSDGKNVTLEKENGKRETLPLDEMRWSDRNFVRYRLLEEANQPPALRTWCFSSDENEIRAKFVSGDEKTVVLERENGQTMSVVASLLSPADQEYVKQRLATENSQAKKPD